MVRVLLVAALVTALGGSAPAPYEADAIDINDPNPHPRRYYIIYREILQPGRSTVDTGVIVPGSPDPQHDPRIPY